MSFITDETLRQLLAQAGMNPQAVSEGVNMAVQQQLTPSQQYQQEAFQTYQSAQAMAPPINVRVKEVEPPVRLKATLELSIDFPYDSLVGLPEQEVKDRIYRVISGENDDGTWLPVVRFGSMDVWREVVRSEPRAEPVARNIVAESNPGPAFKRAVRPASGPDDIRYAGDSEHRDAVNDAERQPADDESA